MFFLLRRINWGLKPGSWLWFYVPVMLLLILVLVGSTYNTGDALIDLGYGEVQDQLSPASSPARPDADPGLAVQRRAL
jgi:hypothetical protein